MKKYEPSTYGDSLAERYDRWYPEATEGMIDRIAELSCGGKVLELGIGTGRVALPLRERGVEIFGVEASEKMLARLQEKGGGDIPVAVGDFSKFELDERFDLVILVFNTIFALLTQEEQVDCFRSVSKVLGEGGKFLIEAFVPDPGRFDRGQSMRAWEVGSDRIRFECGLHDAAAQTVDTQMVEIADGELRMYPLKIRYSWPAELDLMARLAGLRLLHRWGGWAGEPFGAGSIQHVSVYGS